MKARRSTKQARTQKGGQQAAAPAHPPLAPDRRLLRVAVAFFLIYALLQVGLWALVFRGFFTPVQEWTASLTGACSAATGIPAVVMGTDVALPSRILRIDADCTGVTLVMIYAALVLAYPLDARRKLVGLVVGTIAILGANMVRLVAVAQLSGPLEDRAFMFVHDYLFKIVMMAVVIAAWALYLTFARRHASHG